MIDYPRLFFSLGTRSLEIKTIGYRRVLVHALYNDLDSFLDSFTYVEI